MRAAADVYDLPQPADAAASTSDGGAVDSHSVCEAVQPMEAPLSATEGSAAGAGPGEAAALPPEPDASPLPVRSGQTALGPAR
eukprot:3244369-Alexandrium_andersonii.AAC.1